MRLVVATLVVVACASCGDNAFPTGAPLRASDQLVVVAHQDDDHLFMQPDLQEALLAHTRTTIVYVTAGDAGSGLPFAEARLEASKYAYGLVLGSQAWHCGWIDLAHHAALHCRLAERGLSLVFLGYPDGGVSGEQPDSLLALWEDKVHRVHTIAENPASYDREGLVETVAQIITTTQPQTIRTLEVAATHGTDHSDHLLVGTLTMVAALRAASDATLVSYRGYNVNYEPGTNPEELYEHVSLPMRAYEACVTSCTGGVCGVTPCDTLDDPRYNNFLHRRYAVAMRAPPLAGILHASAGCLVATTDGMVVGDCAGAAPVDLRPGGLIGLGGGDDTCLEIEPDRSLAIGPCTPAPNRAFMLDDEGHLWTSLLPVPQPGLDLDHGMCVVGDAGGLRVDVCGPDRDARWDLLRPPVVTPRASTSSTSQGRAVRMADLTGDGLADLCFIGRLGLACAAGDGTGHFGRAQPILASNFAIEPQSLALGDVDGDGFADACGRDAQGLLCATAASSFTGQRWSSAFASTGPASASDQSLAIVEGALCGVTMGDVVCVRREAESVLSMWPQVTGAPMWPADLDGDDRPDWCIATTTGANCGLAAEAAITDDGVGWSFSNHAQIEGSVAVDGAVDDVVRSAIADISGDGRADMCVAIGNRVECAISQGHGFGPRRLALVMPTSRPIVGLWLGDVDGDGKADPCADDGTQIACALSP